MKDWHHKAVAGAGVVAVAGLVAVSGFLAANKTVSLKPSSSSLFALKALEATPQPDTLVLSVSGYMKQTETVTWAPVPGASGYRLYKDGAVVASAGPSAVQTRFSFSQGQHNAAVWATYNTTTSTVATTVSSPTTTTNTPPTTVSAAPFFTADAETGNLSQWEDLHDANSTSVVQAPVQQGLHSYRFQVLGGQTDSSVGGDAAYLELFPNKPWEQEGADTWYRYRYLYPSGTDPSYPGSFTVNPSSSGWNINLEWHENGCCQASPYLGVRFGGKGALMLRWVGGPTGAATWVLAYDHDSTGNDVPLLYDHWYDMLVHVHWSADATKGLVEWWADGRKIYPTGDGKDAYGNPLPAHLPTLWSVNGQPQIPWIEWGHYRGVENQTDTTYGDDFRIGPTRASVGA